MASAGRLPGRMRACAVLSALLLASLPAPALAAEVQAGLTAHWAGFAALGLFVLAYVMVVAEEFTHLRKSQPVIFAAAP